MKRIEELRVLSSDHHRGLVLAKKAHQAADSGLSAEAAWADLEAAFNAELEPHFQVEEQTLIEPLRALGEDTLVAQLEREHAQLRGCFSPEQPRGFDELKHFGELLKAHIRFEERELFEVVQARFSPEQLQLVADASAVG
ncbi:hypothetical protein GCM10009104_27220 [Marinobacterium maritimum]|uniref:Hemerythrin-like domain-containing protein n=1 Tax=Marinobacterium maritimum TaxID=500162 RepID=A0ABP3TFB2_9GAMM